MTPSALILDFLRAHHRGKVRAITRESLREHLREIGCEINDRDLRETVKTIKEVCTCERGYYVAQDKADTDYSIAYLRKKIFPLWQDIENIKQAYPQFYAGEQMELFNG